MTEDGAKSKGVGCKRPWVLRLGEDKSCLIGLKGCGTWCGKGFGDALYGATSVVVVFLFFSGSFNRR